MGIDGPLIGQASSAFQQAKCAEVQRYKEKINKRGDKSVKCDLCPWRAFGRKQQLDDHVPYHKAPYYTASTTVSENARHHVQGPYQTKYVVSNLKNKKCKTCKDLLSTELPKDCLSYMIFMPCL